jgi:hypothetical protein
MKRVCLNDVPLGSVLVYVGVGYDEDTKKAQKVYYRTLPDNMLEVVPYIWTTEKYTRECGGPVFRYPSWDAGVWELVSLPEKLNPEDFL